MATKYKQQADGRWQTKIWDGTYKDGKKHYVALISSKSSKDLERIVSEYIVKREKGLVSVSTTMSVYEYAQQWLEVEKGLSESATRDMYRNIIEKHLNVFSDTQFEYLTSYKIQNIINNTADRPRTCQQIVLTLKQICKSAESDRLLPSGKTIELFNRVQIPKYKAEEKKPLTAEQCKAIYNALVAHVLPPRSALFLSLIYFCGLRREEALALKIDDIQSLAIRVDKALHLGATTTEVKTPKSERGYRTVPLPAESIPIIRDTLTGITPSSDGYLFTTRNGDIITKSSYIKMWQGIQKHFDFEFTAHQLRHTYCTRLCYEAYHNRTISVKQIAKLLGDTEKMVTDVYGHLLEEQEQTAKALKNIFSSSSKKAKRPIAVDEL